MLPRSNRLPIKDVRNVLRNGKRLYAGNLQIISLNNSLNESRFGFVISAKVVKLATMRNRIKRRLRDSVQSLLPNIPKGKDVIILVRRYDEKDYSQINSLISTIFVS